MLKGAIDKFLSDKLCFNSESTYKFYYYHCRSIIEFFGSSFCLENLTFELLKEFVMYQKKTVCNKTINKRIMIIKILYKNYCSVINDRILYFPKLREVEKTFEFLSYNEVLRLLDYCNDVSKEFIYRVIFKVFLDTGVRLSEFINIEYCNVDLINNCILLHDTKTKKERYVFITDDTKVLLADYISKVSYNTNNFKLFNFSPRRVQSYFYNANKELKFKHFSPHVLRHTYATILVNNNTNLEFIRITLGHSSLDTTKRYLHCGIENLFKVYKEQYHV